MVHLQQTDLKQNPKKMANYTFHKEKNSGARKSGSNFIYTMQLHTMTVKTFCTESWLNEISKKYSNKIKITLSEFDDKTFIFKAQCKNSQILKMFSHDTIIRYSKMMKTIKNIIDSTDVTAS